MIETFKPSNGKVRKIDRLSKGCWINVTHPSEEDMAVLKSVMSFPDNFITSLKDIDELPSIEKYKKSLCIIFRTPQKRRVRDEFEYFTIPLGIIITKNYMTTICFQDNDVMDILKTKKLRFEGKLPIIKLLFVSTKLYLKYLREINKEIYITQNRLQKSTKNEEIIKLLEFEKYLVYFSTSLKSNGYLLDKLNKNGTFTHSEYDKGLIEDIIEENRQALEMTTIYSDILSSTMDAFASVISNNLNIIMKLLTSITIVLMIPTLIASVFGMNVDLPFQNSGNAFLMVMAVSFICSAAAIAILWRKKFV